MKRAPQRYQSSMAYLAARLKNSLRRRVLGRVSHWTPLKEPRSGYTIIIALPWQSWELTSIPLLALKRARRTRCAEIILAVNASEKSMLRRHGQWKIASMVKAFGSLSPRIVYCTARQEVLARRVKWDGLDRWLNLVNGLSLTRTRHALLHDPETILIDREFCERHFDIATAGNHTFTGIQRDVRHESERSTDLLMTIELMIDVAAIRSLFSPVDLYHRVWVHDGQRIQSELLGDAQWRLPDASRILHEVRPDQIVSLSPLISQWSAMKHATPQFTPQRSTPLLAVPYFRHMQGEPTDMHRACEALERRECAIKIDGCTVDLSNIDQPSRDLIADQIERLDAYFTGAATPEVRRYATAIGKHPLADIDLPIPEIVVNRIAPAESKTGQSLTP